MTRNKHETNTGQPNKTDTSGSGEDPRTPLDENPTGEPAEPRVVYHRAALTESNAYADASTPPRRNVWVRKISPAIVPLIVGFLLLLILIGVLGLLSVSRMDEVGNAVLNLEQQHAAKLTLLL
jgi:hypothetical protein